MVLDIRKILPVRGKLRIVPRPRPAEPDRNPRPRRQVVDPQPPIRVEKKMLRIRPPQIARLPIARPMVPVLLVGRIVTQRRQLHLAHQNMRRRGRRIEVDQLPTLHIRQVIAIRRPRKPARRARRQRPMRKNILNRKRLRSSLPHSCTGCHREKCQNDRCGGEKTGTAKC